MKKQRLFLSVLAVLLIARGVLPAAPVGASNETRDYLIAAKQLSRWSCGTALNISQSDITAFGSGAQPMDTTGGFVFLGFDIVRWITAYGLIGGTQRRIARDNATGGLEYGAGLHFNIFDHDIMDPTLFENRLRLNADCHATYTEARIRGRDGVQLIDTSASILGSVVNDLDGSKFFVPRSIALYAGPVYNSLQNGDRAVRTLTPFGATAGLEIYWSPNFSWRIGLNTFNGQVSPDSGVNIRF